MVFFFTVKISPPFWINFIADGGQPTLTQLFQLNDSEEHLIKMPEKYKGATVAFRS